MSKSKEIKKIIDSMSNKQLIENIRKKSAEIVPTIFLEDYDEFILSSKPEYGGASKLLAKEMSGINKEDFIILDILKEEMDLEKLDNKKIQFVPFDKIFIQTNISYVDSKDILWLINSLILIKDKDKNIINVFLLRTNVRTPGDRDMCFHGFYEDELNLKLDEKYPSSPESKLLFNKKTDIKENSQDLYLRGFIVRKLIRFLSYKINTKEYRSYKKYSSNKLIKKEIVYSSEVKAHKRHFWKDSGKFKIPLMTRLAWEKKGYETDEVVFKDNEMRRNVPYLIIGQFLKNKELKKENRKISLIKKRVWKCEEKVFLILREIFPDKYIRRHDRRTLNGLELDFNIPELRLGIEYDGEQHFDRKLCEGVFKSNFDALVKRDRDKEKRCRRKNIKLIRIKYDEPLNKTYIKKKIRGRGIKW